MKLKIRMMAAFMALVLGTSAFSTPAFAYTGEAEKQVTENSSALAESKEVETEKKETPPIDREKPEKKDETTFSVEGLDLSGLSLDGLSLEGMDIQKLLEQFLGDGNLSLTYRDGEGTKKKIGTVKTGGDPLNVRDHAGKGSNIIFKLPSGSKVDVLEKEGDWYKISVPEQVGYVYKDYLKVETEEIEAEEYEISLDPAMLMSLLSLFGSDEVTDGLTPPGNLTLIDDYGKKAGAGQQFITLVTKNGNYFYLIIDRDDKGEENVHFLNMVDEADLFALMDEDQVAEYQAAIEAQQQETKQPEVEIPSEKPEEPESKPEIEEKPERKVNWAPVMLFAIVMVGGIGAFLYSFISKKKKKAETSRPDPDADYEEDDEEEYILPEDAGEDSEDSAQ